MQEPTVHIHTEENDSPTPHTFRIPLVTWALTGEKTEGRSYRVVLSNYPPLIVLANIAILMGAEITPR